MKNKATKIYFTIMLSGLLTGCSSTPKHTPHIVNDVNQRGMVIAAQTQNHLRPQLVNLALHAYNNAQLDGFGNKHILSIIDYSLPSTMNRLWIINLDTNQVLFAEKVAHGIGSGTLYATQFSDQIDSRESSIGMYQTRLNGYRGRHGYSLRLIGLEPGYNDQAFKRAIVLHSAPDISDAFIQTHGFLGLTWGCPAINPAHIRPVINTLSGGTLIFAYANDPAWLKNSRFLQLKPV